MKNFRSVWTHLGNVETKIGILEQEMTRVIQITKSTPNTVIEAVQALEDKIANQSE